MFKRYSQFSGGTCDPLVIHWPKGIKAKGEVRHQYHHSTDIVPTILDVVGLEMPKVYRGVEQFPLNGVSMRYTFGGADAPTTEEGSVLRDARHARDLEGGLEGGGAPRADQRRGAFRQGSVGAVPRGRRSGRSQGPREGQSGEAPGTDQGVVRRSRQELRLPLDDRTAVELLTIQHPVPEPPRTRYLYCPARRPCRKASR